ncbi:unnamed protein product [Calypogeia fissa]
MTKSKRPKGRGRRKTAVGSQAEDRFSQLEEEHRGQQLELLPGVPDEITLEQITSKLPWVLKYQHYPSAYHWTVRFMSWED